MTTAAKRRSNKNWQRVTGNWLPATGNWRLSDARPEGRANNWQLATGN